MQIDDVEVQELGLQEATDETGESVSYYAVSFSLVHEGTKYGMVLSLHPDTEPGDPHYVMALEKGKQAVLAKAQEAQ